MDETVIELLDKIDGISTSDGLYYCGSDAAYLKFLNSFYHSIEVKATDIEDAYSKEDFTFYTSKVHSLKSTSRIIGASDLSDFALKLEEAGRSGNIDFIRDNNDRFLELYRSYIGRLSVLESLENDDDDSRKEIPEDELKEAYSALADVIPMMDFDAVEVILNGLKEYKLPREDAEIMNKLDKLLKNMKWDDMMVAISGKFKTVAH